MAQEITKSVTVDMAEKYGMEVAAFEATLRATVFPAKGSREQFAAFLMVAKKYNLDPITHQIYAFPTQGGGVQPIVSIDGWMNLINSHPDFDGMEFEDNFEDGKITAITCRMYRKDRSHPTSVTEYMSECARNTSTWKQWPARMLRHKAAIQAARYAFGFSGIVDPDEAERIREAHVEVVTVEPERPAIPALSEKEFMANIGKWQAQISSGMDPEALVAMLETRWTLTENQRAAILNTAPTEEAEEVE